MPHSAAPCPDPITEKTWTFTRDTPIWSAILRSHTNEYEFVLNDVCCYVSRYSRSPKSATTRRLPPRART